MPQHLFIFLLRYPPPRGECARGTQRSCIPWLHDHSMTIPWPFHRCRLNLHYHILIYPLSSTGKFWKLIFETFRDHWLHFLLRIAQGRAYIGCHALHVESCGTIAVWRLESNHEKHETTWNLSNVTIPDRSAKWIWTGLTVLLRMVLFK